MASHPHKKIQLGSEFDFFLEDGCEKTGAGYFFECAWFDTTMAGIVFAIVLIATQLISENSRKYKRLPTTEKYEWVLCIANWFLSIISGGGALYVLSVNEWFLDHPSNYQKTMKNYTPALNFFLPWMLGYNLGRIGHVLFGILRHVRDTNMWDMLPHVCHLVVYGIIMKFKVFPMIAVFQMLLESHHFYTSPQIIMEFLRMDRGSKLYKFLRYFGMFAKFAILFFAGPYCLAMLWYHWKTMTSEGFGFFPHFAFVVVIGLNTLLWLGDSAFGIWSIYCMFVGKSPTKYFDDWKKSEKKKLRDLRKKGYSNVGTTQTNDVEMEEVDSDESDSDNVTLGQ